MNYDDFCFEIQDFQNEANISEALRTDIFLIEDWNKVEDFGLKLK